MPARRMPTTLTPTTESTFCWMMNGGMPLDVAEQRLRIASRPQHAVGADADPALDHHVRPHLDVVGQLRLRGDHRRGVYASGLCVCHDRTCSGKKGKPGHPGERGNLPSCSARAAYFGVAAS